MKAALAVLLALLNPFRSAAAAYMERENFPIRSIRGPRSNAGFPIACLSDTGFTNTADEVLKKGIAIEDWASWNVDMEDFSNRYAAADWTITKIGTGAGALASGDGGLLAVTNSAASGDATTHTRTVGAFKGDLLKPFIFSCKFQIDDATNADVVIGMQKLNTTPWTDPTEGIFFKKSAAATIDFRMGNAGTYSAAAAIATLVAATNIQLSFAYDGTLIWYGVNGAILGAIANANFPVANPMTPVFAVRNNTAVARILTLDWFFAGKGR